MSRTYSSKDLGKACRACGWILSRQKGSHMIFVKDGEPRPIVIPAGRKTVSRRVLSNTRKQLGLSKEELADLL